MPKPIILRSVSKSFVVFILFILSLPALAQQNKHYNLLWRISGNGLKQPSYLFGTMHVKDKRVFNQSDSVMLAIQRCDAFATEVHPDSMIQRMFNLFADNSDTVHNLHKLLSKEQYDALAKRFKDHNGYEMDKVDPMFVETSLDGEVKKADDMPTFLDAYLYGIARTFSKHIFGVEKASDQFDSYYKEAGGLKERLLRLIDASDEEQEEGEDKMVQLYAAGNIDDIFSYLHESGFDDDYQVKTRNKAMVASMEKIMATQSLFTAVGVAHLPGDEGIIALLRKAGYTVTAVPATFTGVAARYHVDELKMPWQTYTETTLGYHLDMPGLPVKTNVFGDYNSVLYPDLGSGIIYGIFVFPNMAAHSKSVDIVKRITDRYKTDSAQKLVSIKKTVINGQDCTDAVISNRNGYQRMNIYAANNNVYLLFVGNDKQSIYQPAANRFFNSFKYFKTAPAVPAQWITYTDTTKAFSVKLPTKPQIVVKETPALTPGIKDQYKLYIYVAIDTAKDQNYLIRVNDYPKGTYLSGKKIFFENIGNDFKGKGTLLRKPSVIHKDGFEGRKFLVKMQDFYMNVRVFVRGNRIYIMMKQTLEMPADNDEDDGFFNSLTFLPFKPATPYNFKPEGQHFSIKMPAEPLIKVDTLPHTSYIKSATTAYATNPNSGGYYYIEYSHLSPYYRAISVDSLYKELTNSLVTYNDTLLKINTVTIDGRSAREFITRKKEGEKGDSVRHVILLDNDRIYYLSSRLASEEMRSETANTFFGSLHILPEQPEADILSLKGEKIKAALASKDTSVYQDGKGAIGYYDFDKKELPLIYDLLKQSYPEDSTSTIRKKLISKLENVNDDGTGEWLQKFYADLDGKDELQADILNVLPTADKKKGYDRYLDLLTNGKVINPEYKYSMFRPLQDSLSFAAANFNRILPLIEQPGYRKNILDVATAFSDDDEHPQYMQLVKAHADKLLAHAMDDVNRYVTEPDSVNSPTDNTIYNYLQLIEVLKPQPLGDKFTMRLIAGKPKSYQYSNAVITRLKVHLPVNGKMLKPLLDSLGNRFDILKALYDNKKLNLALPQYTQPVAIAKTCIYNYMSSVLDDDDGEIPSRIDLLGTIVNKTGTYYAFKYKQLNSEGKNYITIWGPYQAGKPFNYAYYKSYSNLEAPQTNWQQQARKLIPDLLKQNSEDEARLKKKKNKHI